MYDKNNKVVFIMLFRLDNNKLSDEGSVCLYI